MRLYVLEFGTDFFFTDGFVLYCTVCEVKVAADKKYIKQHITRDKYLRGIQKRNEQKTSQPMYSVYGNSSFNQDQSILNCKYTIT